MARLQIPGMYYDEEKNKYFKIQPGHVVPKSAKYTREAIMKKDQAEARRTNKEQHAAYVASFGPINRTKALNLTTPTGYILHRSLQPWAHAASKSQLWSTGIRFKHTIYDAPRQLQAVHQLVPFGPETYAIVWNMNEWRSRGGPAKSISFQRYGEAEMTDGTSTRCADVVAPIVRRDYVLVVGGPGIQLLKPVVKERDDLEYISELKLRWRIHYPLPVKVTIAHPTNARNVLLGGSGGIATVDLELGASQTVKRYLTIGRELGFQSEDFLNAAWLGESIVASSYRDGRIILTDTRDRNDYDGSSAIRLIAPSAVHALQVVDQYRIIAAGPESNLHMYDLRYTSGPKVKDDVSKPFISYSNYVNDADVNLPIALNQQFNVLAAGSSAGSVQVFDVWSGREVRERLEGQEGQRSFDWPYASPARALLFNDQNSNTRHPPRLLVGKHGAVQEWQYDPPG